MSYAETPMLPSQQQRGTRRRSSAPTTSLSGLSAIIYAGGGGPYSEDDHQPSSRLAPPPSRCVSIPSRPPNDTQEEGDAVTNLVNDAALWDEFRRFLDGSGHVTNLTTGELLKEFLKEKRKEKDRKNAATTGAGAGDDDDDLHASTSSAATAPSAIGRSGGDATPQILNMLRRASLVSSRRTSLASRRSSVASNRRSSLASSDADDDGSVSFVSAIFNRSRRRSSVASTAAGDDNDRQSEGALHLSGHHLSGQTSLGMSGDTSFSSTAAAAAAAAAARPPPMMMDEVTFPVKRTSLICSFGGLDEEPWDSSSDDDESSCGSDGCVSYHGPMKQSPCAA